MCSGQSGWVSALRAHFAINDRGRVGRELLEEGLGDERDIVRNGAHGNFLVRLSSTRDKYVLVVNENVLYFSGYKYALCKSVFLVKIDMFMVYVD